MELTGGVEEEFKYEGAMLLCASPGYHINKYKKNLPHKLQIHKSYQETRLYCIIKIFNNLQEFSCNEYYEKIGIKMSCNTYAVSEKRLLHYIGCRVSVAIVAHLRAK